MLIGCHVMAMSGTKPKYTLLSAASLQSSQAKYPEPALSLSTVTKYLFFLRKQEEESAGNSHCAMLTS